jgi:hypothetical protein
MHSFRGFLLSFLFAPMTWSFQSILPSSRKFSSPRIFRKSTLTYAAVTIEEIAPSIPTPDDIRRLKADLVDYCARSPKPSVDEVRIYVKELEMVAEQVRQFDDELLTFRFLAFLFSPLCDEARSRSSVVIFRTVIRRMVCNYY